MKRTLYLIIILSFFISGCWYFRIGVRNTGDAIFNHPKKVVNKIKDPVKENVRLSALWVGHSTVLVQMDDKVILTDPLFEDNVGGHMLRRTEAGLDISAIPKLDAMLVSHAHMDHMGLSSIAELSEKFPASTVVIPAGAEDYLPSYESELIVLQTGNSKKRGYLGESRYINGIKVTAVFAEHQGGRYGMDSYIWNVPGCTGYIWEYNGLTVFYAGDTAYDEEAFKALGEKFDIDLALIPIGPCRDCITDGNFNHVATLGALKMFDDLKADYMVPVHFGSMQYFNDPDEPVVVLKELLHKYDYHTATGQKMVRHYSETIKILDEGEQHIFEYK